MYIFKNAIKNLGRNKGRNVILGIIMVCLLAVASVSLSIDSTTDKIKQSYKEMYGSEVFFQPDFEKLMENNDGGTIQFPEISAEEYAKFMNSEYIKETKVLYSMGMRSSNTQHIEQEKGDEDNGVSSGSSFSTTIGGMSGEEPHFNLLAYSDLKYLRDFTEGKRKFIHGEMFKNDMEAIVSEDYANLNNLEIGSKIKLNQPDKSDEIELTVVGIFQDNKQSQYGMVLIPMLDPKNEIIVSQDTLLSIKVDNQREYNGNYTFYLKDPDMLEAFDKEAHENGLSEFLNITTDEMTYNQMVKPIEGIAQTSMMFLMVFLAFACGLLILLSILSVRERKYEVGVLRAIGMKKSQVMRTLLYESFVTMIICLFLGLGIGAMAAKPVSTTMLNNQKKSNEMGSGLVLNLGPEQQDIDVADVQMSADAIVKVSIVGILVALVSTSVGIIYVLRYEPMEILVERN